MDAQERAQKVRERWHFENYEKEEFDNVLAEQIRQAEQAAREKALP